MKTAPDGVDWFGGRWEDVGCWTGTSFFRRFERRVEFLEVAPTMTHRLGADVW
jgi:hypothetical protein